MLNEIGPHYGYFPNSAKTHVLVKKEHVDTASEIFRDTAMISVDGERYLGGAMGTVPFIQKYVQRKVEGWVKEVLQLSKIAETQPHIAYAAFTHGLASKWNYTS